MTKITERKMKKKDLWNTKMIGNREFEEGKMVKIEWKNIVPEKNQKMREMREKVCSIENTMEHTCKSTRN